MVELSLTMPSLQSVLRSVSIGVKKILTSILVCALLAFFCTIAYVGGFAMDFYLHRYRILEKTYIDSDTMRISQPYPEAGEHLIQARVVYKSIPSFTASTDTHVYQKYSLSMLENFELDHTPRESNHALKGAEKMPSWFPKKYDLEYLGSHRIPHHFSHPTILHFYRDHNFIYSYTFDAR